MAGICPPFIGSFPPSGGGGGGVQSVNGDVGPNVVLTAASVGALPITGGTMTGAITMNGNNIVMATGSILTAGDVGAATFNGSTIEATSTAAVKVKRDYTSSTRPTPSIYVGPGFLPYLIHNFTVPIAAVYELNVNSLSLGSSANTQIRARLLLDGVIDLGGPFLPYGVADGVFSLSGFAGTPFALTPGPHTLAVEFEVPGGPGTVTVNFAYLSTWTEE